MAMSINAMNWCRELSGLSGVDKSILMYISDRYNEKYGYAWPSLSRISADTSWAVSTISAALRRLEKRDYIRTYKQFYSHDGGWASNRYYLPIFGDCPLPGTVFEVGGQFDVHGDWDPDL